MSQNKNQFTLRTISFTLAISIFFLGIITEIYPSASTYNLTPHKNTLANKSLFDNKTPPQQDPPSASGHVYVAPNLLPLLVIFLLSIFFGALGCTTAKVITPPVLQQKIIPERSLPFIHYPESGYAPAGVWWILLSKYQLHNQFPNYQNIAYTGNWTIDKYVARLIKSGYFDVKFRSLFRYQMLLRFRANPQKRRAFFDSNFVNETTAKAMHDSIKDWPRFLDAIDTILDAGAFEAYEPGMDAIDKSQNWVNNAFEDLEIEFNKGAELIVQLNTKPLSRSLFPEGKLFYFAVTKITPSEVWIHDVSDPKGEHKRIPRKEFLKAWSDPQAQCEVVILKRNKKPVKTTPVNTSV